MPPIAALILCTIFVIWLLRVERKQSPDTSWVLWIPTIWMLSIASKPFGVWFPGTGDVDGSPLDRFFQSSVLLIGLIIIAWRKTGRVGLVKNNWPLLLLVGYMFVSILWSSDQFLSFKRWIRDVPAVVMAFVILTDKLPRQALESLFRRSVYILIPFSLMLIKYYPHLGVEYTRWSGELTWIGVTMQKNGLGRLCMFATFFLIWSIIRRNSKSSPNIGKIPTYPDMLVLGIALWLLIGSEAAYSATALVALSIGLLSLFSILWMKKVKIVPGANTFSVMLALIIIFGIVTFFVGGATVGGVTNTLGREATLTGRTDVWVSLLPAAMKQQILGHGFGSFWTTETRAFYNISEAHSGYLEVLLELGFIGLIIITLFLIHSIRKAQQILTSDFYWGVLWIGILLMAGIHNIAESSINNLSSHLTATLVFLSVAYENNKTQSKYI